MNEKDSVRLARIEERQIAQGNLIKAFIEAQEKHNETFYETKHIVTAIIAKAQGSWQTIGVFGVLTVAVSSAMAWIVTTFFTGRH